MDNQHKYQCAIVGGGLAGLCLSVQLAKKGLSVVLFEKNQYPFHRVCGEYISMESWDFLESLGIPLSNLNLPIINELGVSSERGYMLNAPLKLGGFGISRYNLDAYLSQLATGLGVKIIEACKVSGVETTSPNDYRINTTNSVYFAEMVCGSFGKYTPSFLNAPVRQPQKNNYVGIKYHVKGDLAANRIELHNFEGGYCGVSKVDQDQFCVCYLSDTNNLRNNGNDIKKMEERVLYKNPFLKKCFTESTFVTPQPQVVSNVTFTKKATNQRGILMLGDAAGAITPLCGNGMSMAMRASKIVATLLVDYFDGQISKQKLFDDYQTRWNSHFAFRLQAGRSLQSLFGKTHLTEFALRSLNILPSAVTQQLISLTHGHTF